MKKRFFFVLFTIFISAFLFCKSSPAKKTKPVIRLLQQEKLPALQTAKKEFSKKHKEMPKANKNPAMLQTLKQKAKILYGTLNRLTPQEMLIT